MKLFRKIFVGACGVLTLILLCYFLIYDRGNLLLVMIRLLL